MWVDGPLTMLCCAQDVRDILVNAGSEADSSSLRRVVIATEMTLEPLDGNYDVREKTHLTKRSRSSDRVILSLYSSLILSLIFSSS